MSRRPGEPGPEPGAGVPYVIPGQRIKLVRWRMLDHTWTTDTIQGIYEGRDEYDWSVQVNNETLTLPRSSWSIYR